MRDDLKKRKIFMIIVGVIVLLSIAYIIYMGISMNNNKVSLSDKGESDIKENEDVPDEDVKQTFNIVDINSDSRPIAVMINNLNAARPYHSGLQDAYIVYEMIVEGGITRMMALFKDKDTARIGSVRSSRHYYLDYALENDAIYVHYGWSPQAQSDISTLGVNNINGLYDNAFWRDNTLKVDYEHTAFTSISKILDVAKKKNYSLKSEKDLLLNYSKDEINLSEIDGNISANSVDIKYSNYITTSYVYNPNEKVYYRNVNDKPHNDYVTKKQYSAKNIIIAYMNSSSISNDSKGRQNLDNIGSGNGYYITDGKAVPITWTKTSRKEQTIYKYKNGEEIVVNDGNTFIQNAPLKSAVIK